MTRHLLPNMSQVTACCGRPWTAVLPEDRFTRQSLRCDCPGLVGGNLWPMTVTLENTKTALLFVVRAAGDIIVRGPFVATERDAADRAVALTNEQLTALGAEPDAVLAEVTQSISYGKPKVLAESDAISTDDTPSTPTIDPAGPAAVQSQPGAPVTLTNTAIPTDTPTA